MPSQTTLSRIQKKPLGLRQKKLDDYIKCELHRLSSRLDATDQRIQRLIGGDANPKQFIESARGLFKSEVTNQVGTTGLKTSLWSLGATC